MRYFDYNTANYQPKFNKFGGFCYVLEDSEEW